MTLLESSSSEELELNDKGNFELINVSEKSERLEEDGSSYE